MRAILMIWAFLASLAQSEEATNFIRAEEDDKTAHLQTAVTTYHKNGISIDLVGAVHIADKGYFEALTKQFQGYDGLLFEMIGGENMGKLQKEAKKEGVVDFSPMAQTYALIAKLLKLSEQKKEINYSAKNFVHADLTAEEFMTLQKKRGESILSFAMNAAKDAKFEKEPSTAKILKALISGDDAAIKLEVIHALGAGDEQMGGLIGQSVIITDRNEKCFKVLKSQMEKGRKKLGIFYGAAHFPDMEKRLIALGFQKKGHKWLNAWTVSKE